MLEEEKEDKEKEREEEKDEEYYRKEEEERESVDSMLGEELDMRNYEESKTQEQRMGRNVFRNEVSAETYGYDYQSKI